MKVGVVGAGAWGTALAILSVQSGNDVTLWSFDGEYKTFDNVVIPSNLVVTTDMSDLKNMDSWLVVTPAAFVEQTMRKANEFYCGQPIIICTKGADSKTGKFISEIVCDEIPNVSHLGVLSGPQFAAEVAQGFPTGSTIAGDKTIFEVGHLALKNLYLSESDDIIGTQICGVGKNAVALIAGYNSVAASGENERALLFTRAWGEVIKIGCAMGAKIETFCDLCGVGDLFLSATSETSRNFSGGMALAQGQEMLGTVEGVFALNVLIARANDLGLDTPVIKQMQEKMKL